MKSGYYISRARAVILVIVVVAVIVAVGLIAALINRGGCSDPDLAKDGEKAAKGSSTKEPEDPGEPGPWQNPFLPNHTIPVHYNLSFYPDFYYDGHTFTGTADIVLNITEPTQYIIVHYKMMDITKTTVRLLDSGKYAPTRTQFETCISSFLKCIVET